MDYTLQYRPKTKDEFIGNQELLDEVIENVGLGVHTLLVGKPGWGKTSMAHVVANTLSLEIIENCPLDIRTTQEYETLLEKLKIEDENTLYLFEAIDTLEENINFNAIMKESKHPLFFTASNSYKVPFSVKKYSKLYQMKPPFLKPIADKIKTIAKQEKIPIKNINFSNVTSDIRAGIISALDGSSKMSESENDFQLTESAFKNQEIVDLHPAWLMDNVHNFYHGLDVYNALKIIQYVIETGDTYFQCCLPKSTRGKANYPYYLRKVANGKSD